MNEDHPTISVPLAHWFASDDTGISSTAIALWMASKVQYSYWGNSTPSDPSDFGRCYRLLQLFPKWREEIEEMAGAGGAWPVFARRWAEIEALYVEEIVKQPDAVKAPKTYEFMMAVRREAGILMQS